MKVMRVLLALMIAIPVMVGCAANPDNQDKGRGFGTQNFRNDDNLNSTDIDPNRDNRRMTTLNDEGRANNGTNDDTRMEVAEEAADKVSELNEVKRANVIVTNRNAYVAVVLNEGNNNENITRDVEDKISRAVKETDKNIRNVYVSANPNFTDRMTGYGDRIQRGEPVRGFFDEFTEMVRRVFPNAR